jgi:hypothetical protein
MPAPTGDGHDVEDLRRRVLSFIRGVAPFAYCDACLALRCDASLPEMTVALAGLAGDADRPLTRTRRVCYGCGRALDITALRDAPPSR